MGERAIVARAKGSNVGNPAGYARRLIRDGLSASAALRTFRDAGGRIRDSVWREIYKGVREGMEKAPSIGDLPGHRIPGINEFTPWRAGQGGQFAYQVTVTTRDIGTDDLVEHQWTIMSDKPISLNKAEQLAIEEAEAGAEAGLGYENEKVVGAQTTGLFQTIGSDS